MLEFLQNMDAQILLLIQEHVRQPWMDGFWKTITHLGDGGLFWIVTAVFLFLWKNTRKAGTAALLALVFGGGITNVMLKNMVARTRPYEIVEGLNRIIARQSDFSFPSGHTCASFAAAFAFYRILPRKWGIASLVLASLIALSRLYVGVHYPSDILGGIVVGFLSGWTGSHLVEIMSRKNKVP